MDASHKSADTPCPLWMWKPKKVWRKFNAVTSSADVGAPSQLNAMRVNKQNGVNKEGKYSDITIPRKEGVRAGL